MTVFLDLYKSSKKELKGEYVYPSITIKTKNGESKTIPFVQSVWVGDGFLSVVQFYDDEPHEVVVNEVEYFSVNNE